jgi:alpha-galactosidase
MPKIVLIGAGSYVFARDIITDVLLKPSLKDSSISLVDVDPERLNIMTAFTKKLVEQQGFKTRINSTTDRKEALDGADYVITLFAPAVGSRCWKTASPP